MKTLRLRMRPLALAAAIATLLAGCSKKDAGGAPLEKRILDRFVAMSNATTTQTALDDLRMPAPERERLEAIRAADPAAVLYLGDRGALETVEAKALAGYGGKVLVLPDL